MPTEIRTNPTPRYVRQALDDVVPAATCCLVLVATALLTVILVELEIVSWRVAEVDAGQPLALGSTVLSP